ncbi:regenerating islet-derived protein 4-like [Notolabrus celidotus]|uniref:regenerating islet-derived protein 4-like n=1 Tax=Notolabrus celidotus TaxID=1203425 RepID=UPI00148F9622|nr:regenerating islet-derived protein 4-like [Notolabrus celidotus]
MLGQFVNVFLVGSHLILTICELEVYGEMAAPSFSAVMMGRSVEVVEKKLCWSDALFYCRDFYWDLLSICSEKEQREVEEVLRSVPFPLTKRVWLGLRRELMGDTWFWMTGVSEDFTYFETKSYWKDTSPCGAMDTSNRFHWGDLPCEEHLHFICLKDHQRDKDRVYYFSSSRP